MQDLFTTTGVPVVHAKFLGKELLAWQELFSGFEELYALTYSVGVKQVESVMQYFQYGEVIIGNPNQIHLLPAQIFAKQQYDIGYFSRNRALQECVSDGSFRFFLTNGCHAKIYLLKGSGDKRRVITSSANFSVRAWNGSQKENYTYMDEPEAFDYYYDIFEEIRQDSSDEIGIDVKDISEDGKNLDDLPMVKRIIQSNAAVVIHDVPDNDEKEYIIQTTAEAKKWAKCLDETGIAVNKENILTIEPKNVTKMKQVMKEEHNKKAMKLVMNPELLVDYRQKSVSFADNMLDLQPEEEAVTSDIENVLRYMQGTHDFTGDTADLRATYWKIINHKDHTVLDVWQVPCQVTAQCDITKNIF